MSKKHDLEKYKEMLKKIFATRKKLMRDALTSEIMAAEKCQYLEAEKILNYCRTKKIVNSRHLYSTYFEYSLNF